MLSPIFLITTISHGQCRIIFSGGGGLIYFDFFPFLPRFLRQGNIIFSAVEAVSLFLPGCRPLSLSVTGRPCHGAGAEQGARRSPRRVLAESRCLHLRSTEGVSSRPSEILPGSMLADLGSLSLSSFPLTYFFKKMCVSAQSLCTHTYSSG